MTATGSKKLTANEFSAGLAAAFAKPVISNSDARLAALAAWASYAISTGVQAGNYRWHDGADDFEWDGKKMDAVEFLEFARDQALPS